MDIKLFFKISSLIFCFGVASRVLAIGMITEPIIIEDMLRGGEVSKTITVFNPEDKEVIYTLGTEGEIKDWVKFFETGKLDVAVSKINVPAKKYYDVVAKFKVPTGTPNGKYVGEIFIKQDPKEQSKENGNIVSVSQMVSREVSIGVSDKEIVKLDTTLIPETYTVKKGESLKIKIIYENLGNIALKPSLQVKITSIKDEKSVFNAIFPYPETEEAVKPAEIKKVPVFEWQTTGQPEGRYAVEIITLIDGEVSEKNDFRFDIRNVSLFGAANFLDIISSLGRGNLMLGWMVAGGSLLFVALILILIKKKYGNG